MDIVERLLPIGRRWGRTGSLLREPWYITIHNTANEKAGADAIAHAKYLEAGHYISWHFTIDHQRIVQHVPVGEQAWHTGTSKGNTQSIGIEVCEYPQTPQGQAQQAVATDLAAQLAAALMRDYGIPLERVVTHQSWSGKYCPRDILPHWSDFVDKVDMYFRGDDDMASKNVLVQGFVRPEKVEDVIAALKKMDIRAYVVNSDDARITRRNPEGDAQ